MVKHGQNLIDHVIFDCVTGLNKLEQSMLEWICHYILYGKLLLEKQGLILVGQSSITFF